MRKRLEGQVLNPAGHTISYSFFQSTAYVPTRITNGSRIFARVIPHSLKKHLSTWKLVVWKISGNLQALSLRKPFIFLIHCTFLSWTFWNQHVPRFSVLVGIWAEKMPTACVCVCFYAYGGMKSLWSPEGTLAIALPRHGPPLQLKHTLLVLSACLSFFLVQAGAIPLCSSGHRIPLSCLMRRPVQHSLCRWRQ